MYIYYVCHFGCAKKVLFQYIHNEQYRICATICHTSHVVVVCCCFFYKCAYLIENTFALFVCIPHRIVHKLHIECCSIWTPVSLQNPNMLYIHTINRNDEKQLTLTLTHCICNDFQVWVVWLFFAVLVFVELHASRVQVISIVVGWIFQFFNLSMYQKFLFRVFA